MKTNQLLKQFTNPIKTTIMKKRIYLFISALMTSCLLFATNHTLNTQGMSFSPNNLTVNVGDSVTFVNTAGSHNVNGTLATYANNP